jgi:WD40 repeat protein
MFKRLLLPIFGLMLLSLQFNASSAQIATERPLIDATNVRHLTPLVWLGTGPVFDVQWSPYNDRLAVSNAAGVWLYDSISLQPSGRIGIGADMSVWSPYGSRLATTHDNVIRIWDPITGEQRAVLEGHPNWINSIAWSPDGTKLASASGFFALADGIPGEVRIWDTETHELLHLIGGDPLDPEFEAKSVVWSRNSRFVAAITTGGTVTAWDAESGEMALTFDLDSEFRAKLAWSPNGRYFVVGGGDGMIHVYDGFTGQSVRELPAQDEVTWDLQFNPEGTILASGHQNGVIIFWDVATWSMQRRVQHHKDDILTMSFSSDGTQLAAAGSDDLVRIVAVESGEEVAVLDAHTGAAWDAIFSSDGQQIITSGLNYQLKVWDMQTWQSATIYDQAAAISQIIPSPDGEWIALVGRGILIDDRIVENGLVLVSRNGQTQRLLHAAQSPLAIGRGVLFSPNGEYLAAVVANDVWVWSVDDGRVIATFPTTDSLIENELNWSPDSTQLTLNSRSFSTSAASLWVWDVETGQPLVELVHDHNINAVGWSDSGIQLATVYVSGDVLEQTDVAVASVQLWDVASATQGLLLRGHTDEVRILKWSPDGRHLASGSYDETVRVWDTESGLSLFTLSVLDRVHDIQWSYDGRLILIQTDAPAMWFFDGPTGAFLTMIPLTEAGELAWSPDGRLILQNINGTVRIWGIAYEQDCVISSQRFVNRRWWFDEISEIMGTIEVGESWVATGQAGGFRDYVWWQLADRTWVRGDVVDVTGDCEDLPSINGR